MKSINIDLHNRCECEIRYRMFKGKTEPTPGLFCAKHDIFLDWLNPEVADELIDGGVRVGPYIDRKSAKKARSKTPLYIKIARTRRKKNGTNT